MKSDNSENSAKAKTYNCSECTNSYASISGPYEKNRPPANITAKLP